MSDERSPEQLFYNSIVNFRNNLNGGVKKKIIMLTSDEARQFVTILEENLEGYERAAQKLKKHISSLCEEIVKNEKIDDNLRFRAKKYILA